MKNIELLDNLERPCYIPVIKRHRGAVAVTQLMFIHASGLIPKSLDNRSSAVKSEPIAVASGAYH